MYKNPRGQCLIINVYNINGAIRRWSDLDVKLLSDLFRQLYFHVTVYSDFNGDNLGAEVWTRNFSFLLFNYFSFEEFHENSANIFSIKRTWQCSMLYYLFDESWRRRLINSSRWEKGWSFTYFSMTLIQLGFSSRFIMIMYSIYLAM